MPTLLIYSTKHGTTEKIALDISKNLLDEVKVVNLEKERVPSFHHYETIIIGTSIHMGKIPKKMDKFLQRNERVILTKRLGLFLCCMKEGEEAKLQFESSFSSPIRGHAISQALCGGEFIFSKMNFLERKIIHKVAGEKNDLSAINKENIDNFINEINSTYDLC
ncbi:flavodoxin domain-containing protein [Salipaludibacillus daqingensis]|uniref:flavodoxin domain-containing protein n=1 Tax=Salipaludibacillus daqingensis TaxID=3041001 RepID=UPI002476FE3F|nr:flavodoxin domain-containing protein [Salipaludibacillus daqingensis]